MFSISYGLDVYWLIYTFLCQVFVSNFFNKILPLYNTSPYIYFQENNSICLAWRNKASSCIYSVFSPELHLLLHRPLQVKNLPVSPLFKINHNVIIVPQPKNIFLLSNSLFIVFQVMNWLYTGVFALNFFNEILILYNTYPSILMIFTKATSI